MLRLENDHIQIDELKICYTTEADNLNDLMSIEIGSFIDLFGYRFYRSVSDRFRFFFEVWKNNEKVAQLKHGLYTDLSDPKQYIYFKISNHVLYKPEQLKQTLELPDKMGFVFNNYTAIDLAIDSKTNFTSLIKRMIRDKAIPPLSTGKPSKTENRCCRV